MGDQSHDLFDGENSKQPQSNEARSASQLQNEPLGSQATAKIQSTDYADTHAENVFQISIKLPHDPFRIQIMISTQEQVQDLRQTVMETPGAVQYSCFHLEHNKKRINDSTELSEVSDLVPGAELVLLEDPYTEKEARLHLMRTRELIGANSQRVDGVYGIGAGSTLHDTVCPWTGSDTLNSKDTQGGLPALENKLEDYNFNIPPQTQRIVASPQGTNIKTIKSLHVSPWNPPPPRFRQQGHLLYLQLTTSEGEQFQITSHISGFYVNKSSSSKFDPLPRSAPKSISAHSLLTLISMLSTSFEKTFEALLEENSKRDPLINFQVTNAIPATPWLIHSAAVSTTSHAPDIARTQEAYVFSGPDGSETLRDWNEELQSTRELPRETVQERVFRERLIAKTYAEFTDVAVKGAVLVVRGEVAPLNPTESTDAQIFVYSNVFYSFGADGVGTFASEGGDEAARAAVGKDVAGVKAVNQLDIKGLATAGTIIVDYLGRRIVAQSIVPGIFKQREPDEHQVDYGGVEGRDVVADNALFVPTFSQVSRLLKVKSHSVWDKDGKRHDLEGSVETKGLLGTDGRKYILDLYRLTPLDVDWMEADGAGASHASDDTAYPHCMTVLRPELVDSYWRLKLNGHVKAQLKQRQQAAGNADAQTMTDRSQGAIVGERQEKIAQNVHKRIEADSEAAQNQTNHVLPATQKAETEADISDDRVDISTFTFALNPDVFSGQRPQTEQEQADWAKDEEEVRVVCSYLHQTILPEFLKDIREAEVGFPIDGISLSRLLHKRGINIRYLGKLASIAEDNARGRALKALAEQEMIARGFKHEALRYLRHLPTVFSANCVAHLLNCLLGKDLNAKPKASFDETLASLYPDADLSFSKVTPDTLALSVQAQIRRRYRYELPDNTLSPPRHVPLLRSVCLKLGIQLVAKDYQFYHTEPSPDLKGPPLPNNRSTSPTTNGRLVGTSTPPMTNGYTTSNGNGKRKKKTATRTQATTAPASVEPCVTFQPKDIANMVPVVKDSSPKSVLAEEALEAGKISIMQSQREVGQELVLESLTLHEQIYGVLHPEVARVYHQLAMLYFQLDEKAAAIELAHKAVIISERILGIDSSETVLSYLNLALFEHGNRNTTVAVSCVRHALELWNTIYGQDHPDIMTTLNNGAVMLQQLQSYKQSRVWFERSLALCEEMSGRSSVSTGTLLFQLAQALVLDGDHKGAVHRMREAYSIFLSRLGPEDVNTKESEKWLDKLTQNAVSMAKHAKDVQAKRIRRILINPRMPRLAADAEPQLAQGQANLMNGNESRATAALDSRSIDQLMKFIEGGGDITKTPPPKKRTGKGDPR